MPPPPPKAASSTNAQSDDDNQTLAAVLGRKRKEILGPSLLQRKAIRTYNIE